MDPERRERFCLHAALALGFTAFFASATLGLAPVEYFHQLEQHSAPGGFGLDYGPMLTYGLMGAMVSTCVAVLLAWVGWRFILLPAGRLGFFPGALLGAGVAVLTTFVFVIAFASTLGPFTGLFTTEMGLPPATYLVVLVVLSIPAALLGGLVGGVVGSAQLTEVVGGNERRLPPARFQ